MNTSLDTPFYPTYRHIVPFVILAHIALIFWLAFYTVEPPPPIPLKKMIVKTVALQPKIKQELIAEAQETPLPQVAEEIIKEEIIAPKEMEIQEAPPPPHPEPIQEPVKPKPEPVKAEPVKPIPKKEAPKPAPKAVKPPEKKPIPKPSLQVKPKATPKKTPPPIKKQTAPAAPVAKSAPKTPVKQANPAIQKPDPKLIAQENKKKALLSIAKEKIGKINLSQAIIGTNASSSISTTATPSRIETLSIDKLSIDTDTPLTVKEMAYRDELRVRLKLFLKLPEYGDVKIKLTIQRTGTVKELKIISSASSANQSYIEKNLPKMHLPPFGANFPGAESYPFTITISNE